jgi:hypothetical protein
MADYERLAQLSDRLDDAARRLREASDGEEASRLAEECADLASQAAAELDRLVRAAPGDAAPGQEELL